MTPLHVPPIVVGHIHERVAVCYTGTTKLPLVVRTSYMVNPLFQLGEKSCTGSIGLVEAMQYIRQQMKQDDISPAGFVVSVDTESTPDAPVTQAYDVFPAKYNSMIIITRVNDRCYNVPTSCPDKRYILSQLCTLAGSVDITPVTNRYIHNIRADVIRD